MPKMRKRIAPRILANRLNAKKSTGPKSKSGKQRSAQNAISHGLFKANPFIYQNPDNHDDLILLIGSDPTPEINILAEEVIRLRSKLTIIRNIKAQLYFEIDDLFKSQTFNLDRDSFDIFRHRFVATTTANVWKLHARQKEHRVLVKTALVMMDKLILAKPSPFKRIKTFELYEKRLMPKYLKAIRNLALKKAEAIGKPEA